MAERRIRLWPDPALSKSCWSVDPEDPANFDLIDDLFETMYAAKGRGLAAPQIGVLKQVCVVDMTWKEGNPSPLAFLNPHIIDAVAEEAIGQEKCLSIPDLPMPVSRPISIDLIWDTMFGDTRQATFEGDLARCILHEMDHLNGTVIFDHQSSEDRAKYEARYAP